MIVHAVEIDCRIPWMECDNRFVLTPGLVLSGEVKTSPYSYCLEELMAGGNILVMVGELHLPSIGAHVPFVRVVEV